MIVVSNTQQRIAIARALAMQPKFQQPQRRKNTQVFVTNYLENL